MRTKVDNVLGKVLVFLMVLMCADVLWGVITRYALSSQASWSEELARFLLIWIGVLGAAYTSGQNKHLAIDLLSSKVREGSEKRRKVFIAGSIILFALLVLVIGGSRLMYITFILGQNSPALGIPMGIVYAVLPLSGLIIIYYKCNELYSPKEILI